MNIGIIGLGRMGAPIAAHLAQTAHVRVLPPRAGYNGPLVVERDVTALVAGADVLVTCLRSSDEVAGLMPRLLAGAHPGLLHIDHCSGDPRLSRQFAEAWQAVGCDYVDAALSGTPELAARGKLKLLAGGTTDQIAHLHVLAAPYAAEVIHAGATGSGHMLRLVAGMMGYGIAALSAEILTLAEASGIDPGRVHQMITGTGADSRTFQAVHSVMREGAQGGQRRALPIASVTRDLSVLAGMVPDAAPSTRMLDAMRALYATAPPDAMISDIATVLKDLPHE